MSPTQALTLLRVGQATASALWRLAWVLLLCGLIMWGLSPDNETADGLFGQGTTAMPSAKGRDRWAITLRCASPVCCAPIAAAHSGGDQEAR